VKERRREGEREKKRKGVRWWVSFDCSPFAKPKGGDAEFASEKDSRG
jgi:hypothetical protein